MRKTTNMGRWILTIVVLGFIYTETGIATMLMVAVLVFSVEILVFWVRRQEKRYCRSLDALKDVVGKLIDGLEKETERTRKYRASAEEIAEKEALRKLEDNPPTFHLEE